MNTKELQEIKDGVAAKKAAIDLTRIENNLSCYKDFILNIRACLSAVRDMDDFKEFRKEWRASQAVLSLPAQLAAFHEYIAAAENYNTLLFQITESGKLRGFMPELYDEQVCGILFDSGEVFKHPFNKEYLRNCLVGDDTRKAVYMHLVAVADPSDIKKLMDAGEIRKETIQSLPKAVSVRDLTLSNGMDANAMQAQYYSHLQQLYRDMDLDLPSPIIHKAEKVKGITFEGRDDKLRYIMGQLGCCDETNMMDYRNKLVLTAERYLYKGEKGEEPAVRILATIPGDKTCRKIDIGNLDREFALRLGEYYNDADISIEVEALGIFESSETNRQPFMRVQVIVGDKAQPLEKEQYVNLAEAADEFSMEDIK